MGSVHPNNSTHRKRPRSVKSSTKRPAPDGRNRADLYKRALAHIRDNLFIAAGITKLCAATLKAQAADYDPDVAVLLQRGVYSVLHVQLDEIDALIGAAESSEEIKEDRP